MSGIPAASFLANRSTGSPSAEPSKPRDWSIVVTSDGQDGFHWTATRCGVHWARGWVRTRSAASATIHARQAGSAAFRDFILNERKS